MPTRKKKIYIQYNWKCANCERELKSRDRMFLPDGWSVSYSIKDKKLVSDEYCPSCRMCDMTSIDIHKTEKYSEKEEH